MERQQILVDGARKKRVNQLAKQLDCSASEVYRRAIDAFDPLNGVDHVDPKELNRLLKVLRESNSHVNQALGETQSKVSRALTFYARRSKKRAA